MKKLLVLLALMPSVCFADYEDGGYIVHESYEQYQADRDTYLANQQRQNELLEQQNKLIQQQINNDNFRDLNEMTQRLREQNDRNGYKSVYDNDD